MLMLAFQAQIIANLRAVKADQQQLASHYGLVSKVRGLSKTTEGKSYWPLSLLSFSHGHALKPQRAAVFHENEISTAFSNNVRLRPQAGSNGKAGFTY